MTPLFDVPPIRVRDFAADATAIDSRIEVKLSGAADVPAIEPLAEMLLRLHEGALRSRTELIVVDLVELEFMNSSCFKAFVSWIAAIQDASEHYRVKFVSNPHMFWQSRSLLALTCFAEELITIETAD